MVKQRVFVRLAAVVAVALAAAIFQSTIAVAEPVGVPKNSATSNATALHKQASPAQKGRAAPMALPSSCWGYTYDPHRSYSFASVHGATECPWPVSMIVSINLLRWRWYGLQHLANGYRSGVYFSVDGNAKWYCSGTGTYTYRGESYHRATVGGVNYIAYTANEARFAC
jgi:hypothetical protein